MENIMLMTVYTVYIVALVVMTLVTMESLSGGINRGGIYIGCNVLLMSIINSCVVAHQFAIGIDRDGIGGIPVVVWSMYIRMYVCT